MKALASYNIKGGVGKTTAAVNLAHLSAEAGCRTLIWDLDPQGAATFCLRVKAKVKGGGEKLLRRRDIARHAKETDFLNLDLLPADFSYRHLDIALNEYRRPERRLRKLLHELADDYDHVILDCAPSISLVSESVFTAVDALLVPTIPTPLSIQTLERLQRFFRKNGLEDVDLMAFFSMVDRRKALHRRVLADGGESDVTMLRSCIPYSSEVEGMSLRRAPLTSYARNSRPARAFRDLWTEIQVRLHHALTPRTQCRSNHARRTGPEGCAGSVL